VVSAFKFIQIQRTFSSTISEIIEEVGQRSRMCGCGHTTFLDASSPRRSAIASANAASAESSSARYEFHATIYAACDSRDAANGAGGYHREGSQRQAG
jgi:hypothetical protein